MRSDTLCVVPNFSLHGVDRSQVRYGRLCRVAVTHLGVFAPAITIRGRGLLRCVAALHIYGALRRTFHSDSV